MQKLFAANECKQTSRGQDIQNWEMLKSIGSTSSPALTVIIDHQYHGKLKLHNMLELLKFCFTRDEKMGAKVSFFITFL